MVGHDAPQIDLYPIRQGLHMQRGFAAQWRQGVLHMRRDDLIRFALDDAVGFQPLQGLCLHALADTAYAETQVDEALRAW